MHRAGPFLGRRRIRMALSVSIRGRRSSVRDCNRLSRDSTCTTGRALPSVRAPRICRCSPRGARATGIPVVMHAMKTFDTWRRRSTARETAKRVLFPRVSRFLVPGPDSAMYVAGYGVKPKNIVVVPEPVDVERFRQAAARNRPCDEESCRSSMLGGFGEGKVWTTCWTHMRPWEKKPAASVF